jgi:hypothetical protein
MHYASETCTSIYTHIICLCISALDKKIVSRSGLFNTRESVLFGIILCLKVKRKYPVLARFRELVVQSSY